MKPIISVQRGLVPFSVSFSVSSSTLSFFMRNMQICAAISHTYFECGIVRMTIKKTPATMKKKVNWNFLLLEHWVKNCRTLYFMQLEFGVGEEIGVGERERGVWRSRLHLHCAE